ncbi:MAG: hypothetical protein KJ971_08675 [Firmicutes bacterium]|nr:hypothetical protein [Bacillota bacterium]
MGLGVHFDDDYSEEIRRIQLILEPMYHLKPTNLPCKTPNNYGYSHPIIKAEDLNFPREYYESTGLPKEEIDAVEQQFMNHKTRILKAEKQINFKLLNNTQKYELGKKIGTKGD